MSETLKNMLAQARNSFSEIWKKDPAWSYTPASNEDSEYWTKKCTVFEVFVTHYGDNLFDVAVLCLWGQDSDEVFASEKIKSDLETMKSYATEVAQEFLKVGFLNWTGIDLTFTRPTDEIRFKQITAGVDGKLFGLDGDGTVHKLENGRWSALSMKKFGF
jgi:hypothetical protein